MPRGIVATAPGTTPRRGDLFPTLSGRGHAGSRRGTRDYYMRRNLAVIVVGAVAPDVDWMARLAAVREQAREDASEILVIAPENVDTLGLPVIVDDGTLATRLGVAGRSTPSIFAIDRYGLVFATNAGETETPDLQPEDLPGWLEFIACRCS